MRSASIRVLASEVSMASDSYAFFRVVSDYVEHAADVIALPPDVRLLLSQAKTELIVHFPVRMDDGQLRIFRGYRIQHNNILGPYKGGMRYHPDIRLDEVRAQIFGLGRRLRDALMGLPDRLAPVLAGETDQAEVHRLLAQEILTSLAELSAAPPLTVPSGHQVLS